jgi:hypothetical protein
VKNSCSVLKKTFSHNNVVIPTRHLATLDLVITDEPEMVDLLQSSGPLGASDHLTLTWQAILESTSTTFKKRFSIMHELTMMLSAKN